MAIRNTSSNSLVDRCLKKAKKEIETSLKIKIRDCKKVEKIYGSKADSYLISGFPLKNTSQTFLFFLKLGTKEHITRELRGNIFIKKYIPTPKIILSSKSKKLAYQFILFEYIPGELMAERFVEDEALGNIQSFLAIEKRKEKKLEKLFCESRVKINFSTYAKLPANLLFLKRMFGSRFKDYYHKNGKNISEYFDKKIILNGMEFPFTVYEIIGHIKRKYRRSSGTVFGINGHGDAHHGNIIVNKKIWFIDNEYAGVSTPFMELAKPYYNDFLGTLFFHYHGKLKRLFRVTRVRQTSSKLALDVVCGKGIENLIKITKIKLNQRRKTVHENTNDFLSLNDYLIMCHILTKNPNNYPKEIQLLFVVFTVVLASFNPLKPESIYTFFKR